MKGLQVLRSDCRNPTVHTWNAQDGSIRQRQSLATVPSDKLPQSSSGLLPLKAGTSAAPYTGVLHAGSSVDVRLVHPLV
jgi:hypothetical protein